MYKTNLRDIRFPTENAPIILQKGLITKEDFTHSDCNVTLYKTPYAIAKRIFVWTDIEVLTNEWTLVGNGDYKALENAYTNSDIVTTNDNTSQDTPAMDCFTKVEETVYAEHSVPESTSEAVEEPTAEEVEETVVNEEPSEEIEPEIQEEEIVEDSAENEDASTEEIIDQPAEEVVEESKSVVEEQPTENTPVAVPVNPQFNNQNYTRINNKRNKHNRR